MREGLGPVLGGMHGRVGRDVVALPARRARPAVVPVQRRLVVGVGVAEQFAARARYSGDGADQPVEVVVPDLVAEVPEQRAVRLVHRDAQLLAVHVVALGEIEGDHAVVVAGEHLLVLAGQQVERQPVLAGRRRARRSAASARRSSTISRRLAFSARGERGHRRRVGVVGPGAGQRARRAQLRRPAPPCTSQLHSATCRFAHSWYSLASTAPPCSLSAPGRDHQQGHVVEREPQPAAARQAHRVLERQVLTAVGADEVTHAALLRRTARRRRRRRSRCSPSRCR